MKKMKKVFVVVIAMMVMFTAFPIQTKAATIKLNKKEVTLYVGKSTTLKIQGTKKKVTWSTNKEKIVTVSKNGKVTAKKAGTAIITAKVGKKNYNCKVTVKNPYISDENLTLTKVTKYRLKLYGAEIKSAKSSNEKVAIVTKKGVIETRTHGKATITLKDKNGNSYKCKVTVKKVDTSGEELILKKGKTYATLLNGNTCTLRLNGPEIKSVKSSDATVATVTKKGKIKTKNAGKTTITVKDKIGNSYKCELTVYNRVENADELADTNKDGFVDVEEELGYITPQKQACIDVGYGVVVAQDGGEWYAVLMPDCYYTINGKDGVKILIDYLAEKGLEAHISGGWIEPDNGWYWFTAYDIREKTTIYDDDFWH